MRSIPLHDGDGNPVPIVDDEGKPILDSYAGPIVASGDAGKDPYVRELRGAGDGDEGVKFEPVPLLTN